MLPDAWETYAASDCPHFDRNLSAATCFTADTQATWRGRRRLLTQLPVGAAQRVRGVTAVPATPGDAERCVEVGTLADVARGLGGGVVVAEEALRGIGVRGSDVGVGGGSGGGVSGRRGGGGGGGGCARKP